jgi:hypothetical protein
MIKQKRLIRIEASLTPKQAVLLWLRQECRNKTTSEYARWLIQQPPAASPRWKVEKQVVEAIRAAMQAQDPHRIYHALRQVQMQTDFLILLVIRTNCVILDQSQVRWLKMALLYENLRNAVLSRHEASKEAEVLSEWATRVRQIVAELLSLQAASDLIQEKQFDGECILMKDVIEELKQQTTIAQNMLASYDKVASVACKPELATNSQNLREAVNEQASKTAGFIIALAKSKMLEDFGEHEAADGVVRPYFLESLE